MLLILYYVNHDVIFVSMKVFRQKMDEQTSVDMDAVPSEPIQL